MLIERREFFSRGARGERILGLGICLRFLSFCLFFPFEKDLEPPSDSGDFQLVHFVKYFNVGPDDVDKVRTSEDGTRPRLVLLFLPRSPLAQLGSRNNTGPPYRAADRNKYAGLDRAIDHLYSVPSVFATARGVPLLFFFLLSSLAPYSSIEPASAISSREIHFQKLSERTTCVPRYLRKRRAQFIFAEDHSILEIASLGHRSLELSS